MPTCAISSGYAIGCVENVGGIDAVYFIEKDNISSMTDASGTVTAITKATGKRFWKFEVPAKSTATATSNPTPSQENGTFFFPQTVELPVNRRDASTRNLITVLAKNRLIVVTKDKDGTYRMYGKGFGMYGVPSTGSTGAAMGDANGYVMKFEAEEKEDFFTVASAVGDALETPG